MKKLTLAIIISISLAFLAIFGYYVLFGGEGNLAILGDTQWAVDEDSRYSQYHSFILNNSIISVGSGESVNRYSLEDGSKIWGYKSHLYAVYRPVSNGDVLVLFDRGGRVNGFDLASGKSLWVNSDNTNIENVSVRVGDQRALPYINEDFFFYKSYFGLSAIDLKNGEHIAELEHSDDLFVDSSIVGVGDDIYVLLSDGSRNQLVKIQINGSEITYNEVEGVTAGNYSVPYQAVTSDRNIIFWADNYFFVYDTVAKEITSRGNPEFRDEESQFSNGFITTEPVVDGDNIYFGNSNGAVLVYSQSKDSFVAEVELPEAPDSIINHPFSMSKTPNQEVVVTTGPGYLLTIDTSKYEITSQSKNPETGLRYYRDGDKGYVLQDKVGLKYYTYL